MSASSSTNAAESLLLIQTNSGECVIDVDAARLALAENAGVERLLIKMRLITFAYPMKKTTHSLSLLDVLVMLGEVDIAAEVAAKLAVDVGVQGSVPCALEEWHLGSNEEGTSTKERQWAFFPVCLWTLGQQANLPRNNHVDRIAAAVAVSSILDRARAELQVDYMILLAQWASHWQKSQSGSVELHQPTLLRHIFGFAVPNILLSIPRIKKCIASLYPDSTELDRLLCRLSASAPSHSAGAVRRWCKQAQRSGSGTAVPTLSPLSLLTVFLDHRPSNHVHGGALAATSTGNSQAVVDRFQYLTSPGFGARGAVPVSAP